jgi:signal transduction histidine kinase
MGFQSEFKVGGLISVGVGKDGGVGLGISSEDLPYIFERFYWVDRSRPRATGDAGLDLTIARRLLELHGGTIEVQSERERGVASPSPFPGMHLTLLPDSDSQVHSLRR